MGRPLLLLVVMLLAAWPAPARQIRRCKAPVSRKISYTDGLCLDQSEPQQLEITGSHVGSLPSELVQPSTVRSETPRQPSSSAPKPKHTASSIGSPRPLPMQRSQY